MSISERRRGPRRVLVVDDSALMRQLVAAQLADQLDLVVAGEASTGYEAIRLVHALQPDLITLDLEMPDLGGLDTLRYIMNEAPRPVVIVSAQTAAMADPALRATMELGAVEVVAKPGGDTKDEATSFRQRLLLALRAAAAARHVQPHPLRRPPGAGPGPHGAHAAARCAVAVAASTGGPRALSDMVPQLPRSLTAAVLIVQHMPPLFTAALARRLDDLSPLHVCEAEDGAEVCEGTAYVAPGGRHMDLERTGVVVRIRLSDEPPVWNVRPSADVLFHAVARSFGPASVGVVLTGMGRDGADGSRAIRAVGGTTLVQDEESCVIPSMPRAAAVHADAVVPLGEMAAAIAREATEKAAARGG